MPITYILQGIAIPSEKSKEAVGELVSWTAKKGWNLVLNQGEKGETKGDQTSVPLVEKEKFVKNLPC